MISDGTDYHFVLTKKKIIDPIVGHVNTKLARYVYRTRGLFPRKSNLRYGLHKRGYTTVFEYKNIVYLR